MSAMPERQLHLNAFLMNVGHHEASWRLPESNPHAEVDIEHFRELARIAERGLLDSLFLADRLILGNDPGQCPTGRLDPTLVLAAVAGVTSHIGLIATASTGYEQPYNLARRFASLDHISAGRAAWNIVTTAGDSAARNFGLDQMPSHRDRYLRAMEFVEVVTKLWDSWAADAVIADKERGIHADSDRIRKINHVGPYFKVRGPLNVPRCPQGYPVLVQAGSSEDGREFAARFAEVVFTVQQALPDARAFYRDVKQRALEFGRSPDEVLVLPGIAPVIGDTEVEAQELAAELDRLIVPEYAKRQLAIRLKISPDDLDLDGPLPSNLRTEDEIEGGKGRYTVMVEMARREQLTVREMISRIGGGRGHRTVAGTPVQIADTIEHWFTEGAADGFNVMPAVLPSGLSAFVDKVVPILQERKLFRSEYTGSTLRDHYGLRQPANYFDAVMS